MPSNTCAPFNKFRADTISIKRCKCSPISGLLLMVIVSYFSFVKYLVFGFCFLVSSSSLESFFDYYNETVFSLLPIS